MIEILEELGFSIKEAKTFICLLKNPNVSGTELSKYLNFDRRTVYDVLATLHNKGYIKQVQENKIKKYSTVNPKVLIREAQERKEKIEKLLPEFENLQPKSNQNVEFLKGRRGFIHILEEVLERRAFHYGFGSIELSTDKNKVLLKDYLKKIDKLGLGEKIIFEEGYKHVGIKNGTYRFLKKDLVPPTTTIIYDDIVVLFLNDNEETLIRIQNKEFAQANLAYFNVYWNLSKSVKS